jgi:exodeoxyribonuclease VII large subunit
MPRPLKSQWNFGELFPPEATRRVFSVSELTSTVRKLIEGHVGRVWVGGEITNLRLQSSGHCYFSIKDAGAQLSCVLFRDDARSVRRDLLQDGQKVVLQGEMTVYEARGQYQLRVSSVELQGVGALQAAFEQLKRKLNAEGLFAAERKRPLPRFPQRIGIVTSPTGAALRDVIHVIERRQPGLEMILAPCRVQGQGAAAEIAESIRLLNEWNSLRAADPEGRLDLILVTRGGGSLEDLWAFNEEAVARAVFESELPVVSAVGHEIDFTICDFVADLRAATPSAAAEIITEGAHSSRQFIREAAGQLLRITLGRIEDERETLTRAIRGLARAHPRRRIEECAQRLDDLQIDMVRGARLGCREFRGRLAALLQRLVLLKPSQRLKQREEALRRLHPALLERTRLRLAEAGAKLSRATDRLRLLSPENVLDRGYSITTDAATGRVIRDAAQVASGQKLKTRVKSGEIGSIAVDPGSASG